MNQNNNGSFGQLVLFGERNTRRLCLENVVGEVGGGVVSGGYGAGGGQGPMSTQARRFVQSLTGRRQSDTAASSSTRLVHGHELEEIAVVSCNATPSQVKYGSGPLSAAANGPRIVPGKYCESNSSQDNRLSSSRKLGLLMTSRLAQKSTSIVQINLIKLQVTIPKHLSISLIEFVTRIYFPAILRIEKDVKKHYLDDY